MLFFSNKKNNMLFLKEKIAIFCDFDENMICHFIV